MKDQPQGINRTPSNRDIDYARVPRNLMEWLHDPGAKDIDDIARLQLGQDLLLPPYEQLMAALHGNSYQPVLAMKSFTAMAIIVQGDEVKVVKHGVEVVEVSLDELGDPDFANALKSYIAAIKNKISAMEQRESLQHRLADAQRFIDSEPAIIDYDIRRAFPSGTAGKAVNIVFLEDGYRLTIDGAPDVRVDGEIGRVFVARRKKVEKTREEVREKTELAAELGRQISDLDTALPKLEVRLIHLAERLDHDAINDRLGGLLLGFTVNDRDEVVAIAQKEIDEELSEIPQEIKLQLVAQHLSGRKIPAAAQEALGVKKMIQAVEKAAQPPKSKTAK